jgi:hypothetical protein
MTPSWRKPAGAFLILALIAIWSGAVLAASPLIQRLPMLVQALVYLFAGIVWILPLKPLLRWMETGRWR